MVDPQSTSSHGCHPPTTMPNPRIAGPTFLLRSPLLRALVAGAMPTVRWPDVGHDQPVSLYTCNTSSYFFACRVLAAEFNRYDRLLHVHFDVRGEGDLVPPCFAWLSLGPANSGWWVEASAMPHTLRRVKSGEAAFVAEPVLAASASSSWGHSRWPYIELGGRAWWRGNVGRGKRCSGHVTFEMERFDKKLREHAAGLLGPWAVKSEPLQLNFYYARNPDYERATLAEWPSSEPVSISEVLSTYSSGDGELGVFAAGEVSAKVTLSEEEDTVEYAKQKSFAFAPDRTKSRSEWWA